MIRFSAALVAVAIGVLIGGIATSKLLLVYIAIVVSAVALVALAVGVVLKREELFGEGQGLLPAGAGAGPVLQARAGESQDKVPASAHVAPPSPFQGTAGGHAAAFGGTAQAVSSSVAADPSATDPSAARTAAAGQGRSADPVPPWNTQAARGPWPSSTPDWMPSGPDERAASAAGGAGGRAPSAWQDTTPAGTPGGRAGGWGVPGADTQAAEKAPRSWAAPSSPSVSSDAPAVKPGAGSGSTTPSWFDRLGGQAGADAPAAAPPPAATASAATAPAPASGTGWSWPSRDSTAPGGPVAPEAAEGNGSPATLAAPTVSSSTVSSGTAAGATASGDTGAADEDDDWPTRYSWLDDDTDENGEAGESVPTVATEVAGAGPESKSPPVPGDTAGDPGPEDVAPVTARAPGTAGSAAETAEAAPHAEAGDRTDAAEESDANIIAFPGPAASGGLSQATGPGTQDGLADEAGADGDAAADGDRAAAGETGSEPPATAEGGTAPGAALVTVVPGVPRYHRTDCVLIRFMPEGDVQLLSVPAAKDAGCTPCAACQPEG